VVDVSGSEGRDPIEDFETINRELRNFSEDLANAPQIVAANKSDMASEEQIAKFKEYVEDKGYLFYEISAATTKGTQELMYGVWERLEMLPPVKRFEAQPLTKEELDQKLNSRQEFTVTAEDGIYFVEADWLWDILRSVNMDDYSSLQYFQRVLRSSGIIDKLTEMGINEGDTVSIYDFEFEFVN
jgi:GTP-binding protein